MMQIPILILIYCGTNWYELLVVIGAGNTDSQQLQTIY
jgi:hypothetical protein